MGMKKAEMEAHHAHYEALMDRARSAEQRGLYRTAVQGALDAWPHIDGMMQYERKYEKKEFTTIPAIDMILKYAPLLFDYRSLNTLERLLKEYRRIERGTSEGLGEKLGHARERMWDNHRLWDYLEMHPGTRQDMLRRALGGNQDMWRSVAEEWEKMGLLVRTQEGGTYRLAISTRMGKVVKGKCPACGAVAEAPKALFLETLPCSDCGAPVLFVILSENQPTDAKE